MAQILDLADFPVGALLRRHLGRWRGRCLYRVLYRSDHGLSLVAVAFDDPTVGGREGAHLYVSRYQLEYWSPCEFAIFVWA